MKNNPTRYSSAVGECWMHTTFKVKYCHKIFDKKEIREEAHKFFVEACEKNKIRYKEIGFDSDHVHSILDIGIYSRPQVAKMIKGYIGKKLLEKFPEIKRIFNTP